MGINDISKTRGEVRPEAAGAAREVAKPAVQEQKPPVSAEGVRRPEDMTRTVGAATAGTTLPASVTPAARTVDIVKLTERIGRGTMEVRLHLTQGTKIAKAVVPEGLYAVVELATKANGEVDFDASTMHFENTKGEKVVLDRRRSMFDIVGVEITSDGAIEVDVAMTPFDVDITQKLVGVDKLPKQLSELVALLTGRMQNRAGSGTARGVIDRSDVSYKGFFEARAGTIELAGRSTIELHQNANMFVMGNAAAGMLQINTPENGASLNLESADGSVFRSGPSTLNLRIGFKAERNTRFLMFHDSTLNDLTMTVDIDGNPLTVKIGQLNLDGHEAAKVNVDPRWSALEAQAAAGRTTVPPSEADGSDIEMTVVRQFLEKWPLGDIAGSKPHKVAQLLKDPHNTDISGFYGLFEGSIVKGVANGLELVPYFIRDRLQAMPEAELAIVVQRAYLADLLVRHDEAEEENYNEGGNTAETKEDLADRYHQEVRQLADMYGELLANTTDETRRSEIEAALSRFPRDSSGRVARRDPARDFSLINSVGKDLRPDPEMPAYDAFAYLFERDGSLDDNLRNTIMPALAKKLAGRLPESGVITVDQLSLKPGIQPMVFMALSHPLVKQAMRDPKVRALAFEARGSVEMLLEGFMMRRLEDAEPKMQEKAVRGALAAQQGVEPDQIPNEAVAAVLSNPAQRRAVFDQLATLGSGKFNQGRDGLRDLFMRLGGMEPNGRAEAFINMVIDEVLKTEG
ncbi:MAG: hypothetical protein V3T05_03545, partial [Myxococcota bacterium]